jgi:hypothetical protein
MNGEQVSASEKQPGIDPQETVPWRFPIVHDKEIYYFDHKPEPQEGVIIHYLFKGGFSSKESTIDRFLLQQTIGDIHYLFSLGEADGGAFHMSFKTKEYEYAKINLNDREREALTKTIRAFIDSITDATENFQKIIISPADASYSAEEIEACIKDILDSSDNEYTREELLAEYQGFRVFDLYRDIFGKNFHKNHYNYKSRARARSRYFQMMAKNELPDWEVDPDAFFSGVDFILQRKKEKKEEEKGASTD